MFFLILSIDFVSGMSWRISENIYPFFLIQKIDWRRIFIIELILPSLQSSLSIVRMNLSRSTPWSPIPILIIYSVYETNRCLHILDIYSLLLYLQHSVVKIYTHCLRVIWTIIWMLLDLLHSLRQSWRGGIIERMKRTSWRTMFK